MVKVFLYLFPIRDYASLCTNVVYDNSILTEFERYHIDETFRVLNSAIDKRYRQKGYEIVYVIFPDTKMYGVEKQDEDRVIMTNVRFKDLLYEDINMLDIIKKLGDVDELVVGGYHYCSCVSNLANCAMQMGINTTIDGELTEHFFRICKHSEFNEESYNPDSLKLL